MSHDELKPLPCPFCGHIGLSLSVGSTHRWGIASCNGCGATCGEIRREYPDTGKWHADAIAEWNRRTPAAATPAGPSDDFQGSNGEPRRRSGALMDTPSPWASKWVPRPLTTDEKAMLDAFNRLDEAGRTRALATLTTMAEGQSTAPAQQEVQATWREHPSMLYVWRLIDDRGQLVAEVGSTLPGGGGAWYAVVAKDRLPLDFATREQAQAAAETALSRATTPSTGKDE